MKRGLFRLWVLFSAIWFLAGGMFTVQTITDWKAARDRADAACYNNHTDGPWCKYQDPPKTNPYYGIAQIMGADEAARDREIPFPIGSIVFLFSVPLSVLLFGIGVMWVAAGFRQPKPN
jgi:hypothetical protein